MVPEQALVERFTSELDALVSPDAAIGIAVSGGPDSLALLLLAAAARPGRVEAATVDHALRPESRGEAEMVARLCESLAVPHRILTVTWERQPATALQEQARAMRYRLLAQWAGERRLDALVTAHHLDDQAETLMMRLARGAGVKGLAGMRAAARVPGASIPLIRPLLGWRHSELEALCAAAGVSPARDPSNHDSQFERVRVRKVLQKSDWLDTAAIASSAANLADADAALDWAAEWHWQQAVTENGGALVYRPGNAPAEIRRRVVRRAILALACEGDGELRGRELDRLLRAVQGGGQATLRGVHCTGSAEWRFARAPARRAKAKPQSADRGSVEG